MAADDPLPHDPGSLPPKEECGIEGFMAVDMRVGVVAEVAAFPEARRPAFKLRVDFGPVIGELWTSAQVTNYRPGDLVGRRVVGALNLGSRRIAGFRSDFLLLGALEADGTVRLLAPDGTPPAGAPVA